MQAKSVGEGCRRGSGKVRVNQKEKKKNEREMAETTQFSHLPHKKKKNNNNNIIKLLLTGFFPSFLLLL